MIRDRERGFQKLKFQDPKPFLIRLRELESKVAHSELSQTVKNLRTNSLKWSRELRQAALFCYGMARRIGQTVYLAPSEAQDYDFVASWIVDQTQHFAPVQLKEVVPDDLNSSASIQKIVDSLSKYVDSRELTVAIYLNQNSHFNPTLLRVPQLNIAALWVFGAMSPDGRQWALWGSFLETAERTEFEYPT